MIQNPVAGVLVGPLPQAPALLTGEGWLCAGKDMIRPAAHNSGAPAERLHFGHSAAFWEALREVATFTELTSSQ